MSTTETTAPETSPFADEASCGGGACARDRIFQAAKKLFHRFGIRGVSVDAIAAEANTTKVTLYRVFSSKDELIIDVLKDQSERFWRWWDSVIAEHPGEPRRQIEALFAVFREHICCEEAERGCAVTNAAVEVVDDNDPAKDVVRQHKLEIGRRLRELCREMGAKQPDVLGDSLSLLLSGALTTRLASGGPEEIGAVCDAVQALLDSPALGAPEGNAAARPRRRSDSSKR